MTSYRTVLPKINWDFQLNYPSRHLLLGSCFSQNIGAKLEKARFNCALNPFGILYHPLVIVRVVDRLIANRKYSAKDLLFQNERYISFDHHGKFNNDNEEKIIENINTHFELGRKYLMESDYIYITWGSAFAYTYHGKNDLIVSNCHKIPASAFSRIKSQPNDIIDKYTDLFEKIHTYNPQAKIILSVSPVKHLKDGLVENNRSKATLLLAAEELSNNFDYVYYYPAFELVQDDLRDYRFYANDMAHPSDEAIAYIWQHFMDGVFSIKAKDIYKKVNSLQQAINHRPLHPDLIAYPKFVKKTLARMRKMEKEFDFLSYSYEKRSLEERLIAN